MVGVSVPPKCYKHPYSTAVVKCSNCGVSMCKWCVRRVYATKKIVCEKCLPTLNRRIKKKIAALMMREK